LENIYCSIITIGDELLIGQTIDTNSAWIAQQLNPIGVQVKRRVAVGDNKEDIINALNEEQKHAKIILITGGLGPTNDDLTKPILCDYFGSTLVMNEAVLQHVTSFFERRKRPMLAINNNQALVPNNCEVLFNEVGTAPGLLFEKDDTLIIALPGVPFEMQYLVSTHVLSKISKKYRRPTFIHRTLITAGEGESFVANRLIDFERTLPENIKLAYLPKLGMLKLRLTGTEISETDIEQHFSELKNILANIFVADQDIELEEQIGILLKEKNKTLSVAESCTGGNIAAKITSIKGSSLYFKGGIVPYSIESKQNLLNVNEHTIESTTVVSEATALEMAQNCLQKFNTDYAIAITGYLEKNDHENQIWIALANKNFYTAKMITVPYDREKNTVLTVNSALNLLRLFILENP
jgi:nicotinamide-nucleotide amidase